MIISVSCKNNSVQPEDKSLSEVTPLDPKDCFFGLFCVFCTIGCDFCHFALFFVALAATSIHEKH